ncbi:MAG: glutamine--fructose-6-phosphate transaminase (isomerizing) [Armatimonadetes bacterium]|nr:glutamine--fructose-6-phosphate transaminase (isomerizing) [Armatimonadota bacterium]
MCGIMGYIGEKSAVPILMEGLKKLEYRGYDSAGVAVLNGNEICENKSLGKLSRLEEILKNHPMEGTLGIGHTRWATHGRPSNLNAHPHIDCKGTIAVVHNGIIENYLNLKEILEKEGHKFVSETDTEILAHLIENFYFGNLEEAVRNALKEVKGSYALSVICKFEPDKIIAARKDSPLIIGKGKDENFIASDIPAFLSHTREAIVLYDQEIACISKNQIQISNLHGEEIKRAPFQVFWDIKMAEKGGYKHFMLKEIFEQSKVFYDTLTGRINLENYKINLENFNIDPSEINKIFISACGTAYHAALVGKYLIEEMLEIPVEVDWASEFRYRKLLIDSKTLFIAISQSGETADTLQAAKMARKGGAKTMAVCNVMGSSLTREVDYTLYIRAGIEIGVAATKTFIAQLAAIYLFTFYFSQKLEKKLDINLIKEFYQIPPKIDLILDSHEEIKIWAKKYYKQFNFLYLGRQINFPIALEGALKLKEISYIHAEGYAAGEMKHGPIALIDENVPVAAILTESNVYDKMLNNVKEIKAREGIVLALATSGNKEIEALADRVFYLPRVLAIFTPLLNIIPLQLLAYYIADRKGTDVDQPRNLAKSVTVE